MKNKISKGWWIVIGIAIFFWTMVIIGSSSDNPKKEEVEVVKEPEVPIEIKTYEELVNLKSTIELLDENKSHLGSKLNHLVYFGLLNEVVPKIELAKTIDVDSLKSKAEEVEKFIIQNQKKTFPKLRKEYFEIIKKDLWLNDVEVTSSGTGTTRLHFTGGIFAANQNKQDFMNEISSTLHKYRFKRAYYKWYEYDDDGVFYTLESKEDGEL